MPSPCGLVDVARRFAIVGLLVVITLASGAWADAAQTGAARSETAAPSSAAVVDESVAGSAGSKAGAPSSATTSPAATTPAAVRPWFDAERLPFAILLGIVCGAFLVGTELARRGYGTFVRPIAGLQAIENALGRATEMGKPCLFVPGIQDMNEIQTVAGLTVLGGIAKTAALYETPIEVPTTRSLVLTAARETMQAAYFTAMRSDLYDPHRIYYVSDEQFAYAAYLCSYMQREQPAACFYFGIFFGESLILAENGNLIGAIQIAGTAETSQLPFFVAACDYTLIGEELFAASAYLSGEPGQIGTIKGQDAGKLLAIGLLLLGTFLATCDALFPKSCTPALQFLTGTVLRAVEGPK